MTGLECFWFHLKLHYRQYRSPSFQCCWVLQCWSDIRIPSRLLLKPAVQGDKEKQGCLTVAWKTTPLSSDSCNLVFFSALEGWWCMQSSTDWQLMDLTPSARVSSFIPISNLSMITPQGNLVRPSAFQNNLTPLLYHVQNSNKTSWL